MTSVPYIEVIKVKKTVGKLFSSYFGFITRKLKENSACKFFLWNVGKLQNCQK